MADPPRPIDYASSTTYGQIDIRREVDLLVITIPPPVMRRTILARIVRGVAACAGIGATAAALTLFATTGRRWQYNTGLLVSTGVALTGVVALSLAALARITRTGTRPTFIRATAAEIELKEPRWRGTRSLRWPASDVIDVSVRERGVLPVIVRYIEFRLVLRGEWIQDVDIPWNGNGALAAIEDNLRDVLGLPPDSAPRAAAIAPPAPAPPAAEATAPTSSEVPPSPPR